MLSTDTHGDYMAPWGGGRGIPVRDQEAQKEAGEGQTLLQTVDCGRLSCSRVRGVRNEGKEPVSNSHSTGTRSSLPAAAAPLPVPSGFTGEASGRPSPPGPSWRRMREAARAGGDYFPRPARAPPLVLARRNAPR